MSLFFPMFVDISQKNVLFIGAGRTEVQRIIAVHDFAGSVTVVSPEAEPEIIRMAQTGYITFIRKRFDETDLEGADIVMVNTGHSGTDIRIAGMCRRRNILVNAESPEAPCDFYFPGIARRDPLVVGVTASGEDQKMEAEATAYFKRLIEKKQ